MEPVRLIIQSGDNYAEISPLPGFSKETLHDCMEELRGEKAPSSSTRFALSCLNLPRKPVSVPVCGLLTGSVDEILAKAEKRCSCTHVKVKIGHLPLKTAIELTEHLLTFPFRLRIDINRKYSALDAITFGKRFAKDSFDYIEEPMPLFTQCSEFFLQTHQPFAFDESLREKPLDALLQTKGLKQLVIKPTLQGSAEELQQIIDSARKAGIECTLSSSFESSLGLTHIAQLNEAFHLPSPPGLDTLPEIDTISPSATIEEGKFSHPGDFSLLCNALSLSTLEKALPTSL